MKRRICGAVAVTLISMSILSGCSKWSVDYVDPIFGVDNVYNNQLEAQSVDTAENTVLMADETIPREFDGLTWKEYRVIYGLDVPNERNEEGVYVKVDVEQLDDSGLLKTIGIEEPTVCSDGNTYILIKGQWCKCEWDGAARTHVNSKAASLNFREGPSTGNTIITANPTGTTLDVLRAAHMSDGSTWYQIRLLDGRIGWSHSYYIDLCEKLNFKPNSVSVPKAPVYGTEGVEIATVPNCDFAGKTKTVAYLEVVNQSSLMDDIVKINTSDIKDVVKYIPYNIAYCQKNAILWDGAGTKNKRIINLDKGAKIMIHGVARMDNNSAWFFVSTENKDEKLYGFIDANGYVGPINPLDPEFNKLSGAALTAYIKKNYLVSAAQNAIYDFAGLSGAAEETKDFIAKFVNINNETYLEYSGNVSYFDGLYRINEYGRSIKKYGAATKQDYLVAVNLPKPNPTYIVSPTKPGLDPTSLINSPYSSDDFTKRVYMCEAVQAAYSKAGFSVFKLMPIKTEDENLKEGQVYQVVIDKSLEYDYETPHYARSTVSIYYYTYDDIPTFTLNNVEIVYGADNCISKTYDDVYESFKNLGFADIICIEVSDKDTKYEPGTVKTITIDGNPAESKANYTTDSKVIIEKWVKYDANATNTNQVVMNDVDILGASDALIGKTFVVYIEYSKTQQTVAVNDQKSDAVVQVGDATIVIADTTIPEGFSGWVQLTYNGAVESHGTDYLTFKDMKQYKNEEEYILKSIYSSDMQDLAYNTLREKIDDYKNKPVLLYVLPTDKVIAANDKFNYIVTGCYQETRNNQTVCKPYNTYKYVLSFDKQNANFENSENGIYVLGSIDGIFDDESAAFPVIKNIQVISPLNTQNMYLQQ